MSVRLLWPPYAFLQEAQPSFRLCCCHIISRHPEYLMKLPLAPIEFGGLMGQLRQLIARRQDLQKDNKRGMTAQQSQTALAERLDQTNVASLPFISNPLSHAPLPFQALRNTYKKGSKGIVISLGKRDFQYACHLIRGLRYGLGSTLPIQIAYAGNDDLPMKYRG